MRPLTDSRSLRVLVARGSIAYSAVTQPSPLPRRQRGTSSWTLAAHSTRVPPNSTSTEPSAWSSQPRVSFTGRSWFAERPSGRAMPARLAARPPPDYTAGLQGQGAGRGQIELLARGGQRDRAGEHRLGLGERALLVGARGDVGQHQVPGPGPGPGPTGLAAGQVQVGRQVRFLEEGRLAQQQVGVAGQA